MESQEDLQFGYDFYCSIALKAAAELRGALNIDEVVFRRGAPSSWPDSRSAFIYRVLDEVQKAGICIIDWFETLKDQEPLPNDPALMTRLAAQWLVDEEKFRARKLTEVLVDLICFSTTNEPEYYRDYLQLHEVEATVRSLIDQEEFFGFRRRNNEHDVDWTTREIIAGEAKLDVTKRWYLKNPGPFQEKWKKRPVEFSSLRQRYIRSLELAVPNELAALGKTYVHAYGSMSTDVHFTPQETSWNFDPDAVYLGFNRVGLLCYTILIRCQLLLDVVPDGTNARLRKLCDENKGPAEIVGQLKQEQAEVGDFVWARGDLCEVMEIRRSKLAYVRYLLRYIERPPNPEIKEDWYAGFEIRLVATRAAAEKTLRRLQTDPSFDEKSRAHFRDTRVEKQKELLNQAVVILWRSVQQLRGTPPAKSDESNKKPPDETR
jgi:hypothetical protein